MIRALPFHYRYMSKLYEYFQKNDPSGLYTIYTMAFSSICFTLWLRIDELVRLKWSDVRIDEMNDDGVLHHLVTVKDRKYERSDDGQCYALYYEENEKPSCAFIHLKKWTDLYKRMMGRELEANDPLFPRTDEKISTVHFGFFVASSAIIGVAAWEKSSACSSGKRSGRRSR